MTEIGPEPRTMPLAPVVPEMNGTYCNYKSAGGNSQRQKVQLEGDRVGRLEGFVKL